MEKYNQYSREQLIQTIRSLESENKFLKEYIKNTAEFKAAFGGEEWPKS